VFDHGEEIGAIDVEPAAEKLFALVREALPQDTTLRSAMLPPKFEPPGGRRKGRPGPAVEQAPIVTDRAPPEYPLSARKAGISGTVQVKALVDRNGNVAQAMVVSAVSADLDSAAVTAVRQWKFRPAFDGHQSVAVWVTMPVKFTLR
jgi:protein TonB